MTAIAQPQHTDAQALDNPVWSALSGPHGRFAHRVGDLQWYSPDIAPFVAVPDEAYIPDLNGAHERGLGDTVYFAGTCPEVLPDGWHIAARSIILQLFPPPSPAFADGACTEADAGIVLGESDRSSMAELTRIAFPDFFRARTAELGLYLGVYQGDRLIAMAGERMVIGGFQEISAVCTHPDFGGRGHARCLTEALMARHLRRGAASFLHVSEGNAPAQRLYESMGFTVRARLTLLKVQRVS